MFGFLKDKIKKGVEKLKKGLVEKKEAEPSIEELTYKAEKIQEAVQAEKEIEYKEKLIQESDIQMQPETKEAIEKPYEYVIKEAETQQPEKILPAIEEPEQKSKVGILHRIKRAISEKTISEEDIKPLLWDMQIGLLENDVAFEVAEKICTNIQKRLVGMSIKRTADIEDIIKDEIKSTLMELLSVNMLDFDAEIKKKRPFTIVFLGFNGVGKTTTIARLANRLKKNNVSCVLAAGDTWRAAAIEQIEEHGRALNIPVIKQKYGADSAAVIFDAKKYAQAHGIDVVLADTAGRSHTNTNLIDELKKIIRVNSPDMKILVLDALTGNDIYEQCKYFDDAVGVDGLIITKADVYEKGGAVISAAWTLKKPLLFLGTGQNYESLEKLDVKKIVDNLLG